MRLVLFISRLIECQGTQDLKKQLKTHIFNLKNQIIMNYLKVFVLFFVFCNTNILAQQDTTYYDNFCNITSDPAMAHYYYVKVYKKTVILQTQFNMKGQKQRFYMYKKMPFTLDRSPLNAKEKAAIAKDSVLLRHGTFVNWYESGSVQMRGFFAADKLQGDLESFYPNGQLKRQDVYEQDVLVSGHCFDENGQEIPHFPLFIPAKFPNGQEALYDWLRKHIEYPETARRARIEGTVYVEFTVQPDGRLSNSNIKQGVDKLLDDEALRVVSLLPKWEAAKMDGISTALVYTLPIKFSLEDFLVIRRK